MIRSIQDSVFNRVHGSQLIYNTCWEDPRLDRVALELDESSSVLVITSAGCNALDYLIAGAGRVHAVDMNPRQNALLELKIASARGVSFDDFFKIFGEGHHEAFDELYHGRIRPLMSSNAQSFWDRNTSWCMTAPRGRNGLYFRGASGFFAKLINFYIDMKPGLRARMDELLESSTVTKQQALYFGEVKPRFWKGFLKWCVERSGVLSMVGVPMAQKELIDRDDPTRGLSGFLENALDAVFGELPLHDNYFWKVYLQGRYTRDCCPEYLTPAGYEAIRNGWPRVTIHNGSILDVLTKLREPISHFVLLDHMDWMATVRPELLQQEWQWITNAASPKARAIWRSAAKHSSFLDRLSVNRFGRKIPLGEMLSFKGRLAHELHQKDRVHTYGSFSIADIMVPA